VPGGICGQRAFHPYPDIAVRLVVLYLLNKGSGFLRIDLHFQVKNYGRELR